MSVALAVSRRRFLSASALAPCRLLLSGRPVLAQAYPYGAFKVGLQSYTLRAFDAKTALDHTKKLGVKYWESFPKHVPMSTVPAAVSDAKKMLADAGVTMLAYGVVPFSN